jgi:hypothetical protein
MQMQMPGGVVIPRRVLALKAFSTKEYRVRDGMGKCVAEGFSNLHQAKPGSALSLQGPRAPGTALNKPRICVISS